MMKYKEFENKMNEYETMRVSMESALKRKDLENKELENRLNEYEILKNLYQKVYKNRTEISKQWM